VGLIVALSIGAAAVLFTRRPRKVAR
jgi:hypothetical protein